MNVCSDIRQGDIVRQKGRAYIPRTEVDVVTESAKIIMRRFSSTMCSEHLFARGERHRWNMVRQINRDLARDYGAAACIKGGLAIRLLIDATEAGRQHRRVVDTFFKASDLDAQVFWSPPVAKAGPNGRGRRRPDANKVIRSVYRSIQQYRKRNIGHYVRIRDAVVAMCNASKADAVAQLQAFFDASPAHEKITVLDASFSGRRWKDQTITTGPCPSGGGAECVTVNQNDTDAHPIFVQRNVATVIERGTTTLDFVLARAKLCIDAVITYVVETPQTGETPQAGGGAQSGETPQTGGTPRPMAQQSCRVLADAEYLDVSFPRDGGDPVDIAATCSPLTGDLYAGICATGFDAMRDEMQGIMVQYAEDEAFRGEPKMAKRVVRFLSLVCLTRDLGGSVEARCREIMGAYGVLDAFVAATDADTLADVWAFLGALQEARNVRHKTGGASAAKSAAKSAAVGAVCIATVLAATLVK